MTVAMLIVVGIAIGAIIAFLRMPPRTKLKPSESPLASPLLWQAVERARRDRRDRKDGDTDTEPLEVADMVAGNDPADGAGGDLKHD